MNQSLQAKLAKMKSDLLQLKTAHEITSTMRTFYASIDIPSYQSYSTVRVRATYAEGTQPIMTALTGDHHFIPLKPSGNTQDFVLAERDGYLTGAKTLYLLSSRKIESLQLIS